MFLLPTNTFPRQISKDLAGPKLMPHLQDTAKPHSHHLPSDKWERVKMTTATLASNILLPLPSTNLTPGMWELSWQHYVQTVPVMTWSPLKYWKQFSLIDWLIHHPKQYGQILQVKFCMCSESVFQRTDFTWESLFCYETDPWEPTHTELAKGLFSSSPVLAYHVSLACLYSLHN